MAGAAYRGCAARPTATMCDTFGVHRGVSFRLADFYDAFGIHRGVCFRLADFGDTFGVDRPSPMPLR